VDAAELDAALRELGTPAVLKTARGATTARARRDPGARGRRARSALGGEDPTS
jgi:hypothetical protein